MEQSPFEKLTGLHLVKKFPTFYGTRRFITGKTQLVVPVHTVKAYRGVEV
jgi:hypothetical protein